MLIAPRRWLYWVGALIAVLLLTVYSNAEAHATLVSSEPAAGSHLATSPTRVRLVFSEQIEPTMASIAIVGADGRALTLDASGDPHDVHALIAPLRSLPSGTFRITWHVISADGHPVGGSFIFTVGAGGAVPPEPGAAPAVTTWGPSVAGAPLVLVLFRGFGVGCLMAAAGLLFFIVWMSGTTHSKSRPIRVARWLTLATPLLLGAHFLVWVVNASPEHALTTAWLTAAVDSAVGRRELLLPLLTLCPLWALWLARRPVLAAWLAIPPLLVAAAVGHSAAVDALIAVPTKALHLAAIAAWLGGLLWLVLREHTDRPRAVLETERVSSVSLVAAIVVVSSGIIQTFILLRISDLWSTYGAVVAAKVLGFGALVAFGAYHRFVVLPRLVAQSPNVEVPTDGTPLVSDSWDDRESSFRRTLSREILVMTLVILLGGLLSYVSPPSGVRTINHLESPESPS